jgi:hypothetical protein
MSNLNTATVENMNQQIRILTPQEVEAVAGGRRHSSSHGHGRSQSSNSVGSLLGFGNVTVSKGGTVNGLAGNILGLINIGQLIIYL